MLAALPEVLGVHALSYVAAADAVRAASSARWVLRLASSPALWSSLACSALGVAPRDASGQSLVAALRRRPEFAEGGLNARLWASTPRTWPRRMVSSVLKRAAGSASLDHGRDDGLVYATYPRLPPVQLFDVCVRGNAPYDLPPREQPARRHVVPDGRGGWESRTGAYFEIRAFRDPDFPTPSVGVGLSACVSVGLCTDAFKLRGRQPGWTRSSFGYHGDDGLVYHGGGSNGAALGYPRFGDGDVVGCGWCRARDGGSVIYFTHNGRALGCPFKLDADDTPLYPVVGMDHGSLRVAVNLGARPFAFPYGAAAEDLFRTMADAHAKYRRGISEEELRAIARSPR